MIKIVGGTEEDFDRKLENSKKRNYGKRRRSKESVAESKRKTNAMISCKNNMLRRKTKSEILFAQKLTSFGVEFKEQWGFLRKESFYVADFYIPSLKAVVEIDGGYHTLPEQICRDLEKDLFYRKLKLRVVRIKNKDVPNYRMSDLLNAINEEITAAKNTIKPKVNMPPTNSIKTIKKKWKPKKRKISKRKIYSS